MKKHSRDVVDRWFDGLNRGDLEGLLTLFAEAPKIRNAANPPLEDPQAATLLLQDFFHRTTSRRLELIDAAEGDGQVFASWIGELIFASGITIKDILLEKPLPVTLRGVERFHLDETGKIIELDIIHETTSVYQAARAASEMN